MTLYQKFRYENILYDVNMLFEIQYSDILKDLRLIRKNGFSYYNKKNKDWMKYYFKYLGN